MVVKNVIIQLIKYHLPSVKSSRCRNLPIIDVNLLSEAIFKIVRKLKVEIPASRETKRHIKSFQAPDLGGPQVGEVTRLSI